MVSEIIKMAAEVITLKGKLSILKSAVGSLQLGEELTEEEMEIVNED